MNNYPQSLYIVGLTGSIGSGKTTVTDLMQKLGATIIDADLLSREVVAAGSETLAEIVRVFGAQILHPNQELNRKALAELVFRDPALKLKLESIVHPQVRRLFLKKLAELKDNGVPQIVVYAVPLLYESKNQYPELRKVILVLATKEKCIERTVQRDKCSREMAEQRYNSQIDPAIKAQRADFVIQNDGGLDKLETEVTALIQQLKRAASHPG